MADTAESSFALRHGLDAGASETKQLATKRSGFYARFGKRMLDVASVLLTAPVVVPTIVLLALLVSLDGKQPFYLQKRLGKGGRVFWMVKLRTMVPDADRILQSLLERDEDAAREWEINQKLTRDPRITRIGHLLRRTSLDELPQLWNVLLGQMSLVGPRPMMPEQRPLYPGTAYFELLPGITGPWQVSERHSSTFASRAIYDRDYLDGLTLMTDVRILWRTVGVVLRCTGC